MERRSSLALNVSADDVYQLESGHVFHRRSGPPADLRAAWLAIGQQLTATHVATFPQSRPHAWWVYVAPEKRRQVSGATHSMLAIGTTVAQKFFYGAPGTHASQDQSCVFECQHEFLERHRLFLPQEATRACAACAYTGGFGQPHLTFHEVKAWYEALTS